jgi:hypothetical protein
VLGIKDNKDTIDSNDHLHGKYAKELLLDQSLYGHPDKERDSSKSLGIPGFPCDSYNIPVALS